MCVVCVCGACAINTCGGVGMVVSPQGGTDGRVRKGQSARALKSVENSRGMAVYRTGEVQVHKSEWLTRLAGGLVKTRLLVFTTLFTTLFCFLLRYLLRYGRSQRMTFMFFGTFQNASTEGYIYSPAIKPVFDRGNTETHAVHDGLRSLLSIAQQGRADRKAGRAGRILHYGIPYCTHRRDRRDS